MNQRAVVCMEVLKENRVYRLELPLGSPWTEAEEVAKELYEKVIELKNLSIEKQKEKEAEEAKEEVLSQE